MKSEDSRNTFITTTTEDSVIWYELNWSRFRYVDKDIEKIKQVMNKAIDDQDRTVQFTFQKRVSSFHAYDRAVREQNVWGVFLIESL